MSNLATLKTGDCVRYIGPNVLRSRLVGRVVKVIKSRKVVRVDLCEAGQYDADAQNVELVTLREPGVWVNKYGG